MRNKRKNNVVMIADDDLFIRKVIRSAFEPTRLCDVVETADGGEVENVYFNTLPDVLLLDIHLPNLSGLELVKRILARDKEAYIVMLSADAVSENVNLSIQQGAKGFITKPVSKKHLMEYFNRCPTVKYGD